MCGEPTSSVGLPPYSDLITALRSATVNILVIVIPSNYRHAVCFRGIDFGKRVCLNRAVCGSRKMLAIGSL